MVAGVPTRADFQIAIVALDRVFAYTTEVLSVSCSPVLFVHMVESNPDLYHRF
jgi:hypothetical protein